MRVKIIRFRLNPDRHETEQQLLQKQQREMIQDILADVDALNARQTAEPQPKPLAGLLRKIIPW